MEGDEYFCKSCKKKWIEENKGVSFCPYCYSKEIVNLSRSEREVERKKIEEIKAKKRKEAKAYAEKMYRHELKMARQKKLQYYRGKGST